MAAAPPLHTDDFQWYSAPLFEAQFHYLGAQGGISKSVNSGITAVFILRIGFCF